MAQGILSNLRDTNENSKSPTVTVLIEDKTARSQWRLAKIIELLKGHDNVRGYLVRTTHEEDYIEKTSK